LKLFLNLLYFIVTIVSLELVNTIKQWTAIKHNFDNILRVRSNQQNAWRQRIIPLATHYKLA